MSISILMAVSLALPQAEFAKYHELITGRAPGEGLVSFAIDPSVSKTGRDAYSIVSTGETPVVPVSTGKMPVVPVGGGATGRTGVSPVHVVITGSNLRTVLYGVDRRFSLISSVGATPLS